MLKLSNIYTVMNRYALLKSPIAELKTLFLSRSGVYVTRNKDTYLHGRMWLNYNRAYNNGINGLVVHKTDRAHVVGNVLWDNGQVSR